MLNCILKCHFISVCYDLNFIELNKFVEKFIEQMLKNVIVQMTTFHIYCNSENRNFNLKLQFRFRAQPRLDFSTFCTRLRVFGYFNKYFNRHAHTHIPTKHTQHIHTHTFALVDRHSLLSTKYLNAASDRKSKMYAKCMSSSNRGEP